MRTISKVILAALLLGVFSCANAAVVQVWKCKVNQGKSDADVEKASSAWLAAAKSMKGGESLEVYHSYPMAANAGERGFEFVLVAPDAATWGAFWNDYDGSAASKADADWNDVASCSGSDLWNSKAIE
jgi:hypothetical protein